MSDKRRRWAYRQWLGLPESVKEPTIYQVLGVSPFEEDQTVIRNAIEQRRTFVESKRGEGCDDIVSALLGEINDSAAIMFATEMRHQYNQTHGIRKRPVNRRSKSAGGSRSRLLEIFGIQRAGRDYVDGGGLISQVAGIMAVIIGGMMLMILSAWYFVPGKLERRPQANEGAAPEQIPATGTQPSRSFLSPSLPRRKMNVVADDRLPELNQERHFAPRVASPRLDDAAVKKVMANIGPTESAKPAEAQPSNSVAPPLTLLRLTLRINEDGSGTYWIKKASSLVAGPDSASSIALDRLPKTKLFRLSDQRVRVIHDFADSDPLEGIFSLKVVNARLAADRRCLVLEPAPEAGHDVGRVATLLHGWKCRLPTTVSCDLTRFRGDMFSVKVYDPARQWGMVVLRIETGQLHSSVHWLRFSRNGKVNGKELASLKERPDLTRGVRRDFQLPRSAASPDQSLLVEFSAGQRRANAAPLTTEIRSCVIESDLRPTLGMKLNTNQGRVFVGGVIPHSVADAADIGAGDTLVSVNGVSVRSLEQAMQLLAQIRVGETLEIEVRRGTDQRAIRFVAG